MEHKFITIGEIMMRLTPPNYEKIRVTQTYEADYQWLVKRGGVYGA